MQFWTRSIVDLTGYIPLLTGKQVLAASDVRAQLDSAVASTSNPLQACRIQSVPPTLGEQLSV